MHGELEHHVHPVHHMLSKHVYGKVISVAKRDVNLTADVAVHHHDVVRSFFRHIALTYECVRHILCGYVADSMLALL